MDCGGTTMREHKTMLKNYLANLQEKVGEGNSKVINEFVEKLRATPSEPSEQRIYTVVVRMKSICDMLNKSLLEIEEKDLIKLNNAMRERGMDSSTYYRRTLKQFLRLTDKKKFFDVIDSDYLKSSKKKNNAKKLVDPNDFWTMEELTNYVEESQHKSKMQGCWAGLLLSTGCRPHELLSLSKNQIKYESNLLRVNVTEGKTGSRIIMLEGNEAVGVWSLVAPYLETLKDNEKLFDFSYEYITKNHKRICGIIGITKNESIKLYNARKMTLTHFYDTLSVVKASAMAGHVQGSNSMKHYVGLSESQMIDGIPRIEMRECPNPQCMKVNNPHLMACKDCRSPLNVKAYTELVKVNQGEKDNQMDEMRKRMEQMESNTAKLLKHVLEARAT